jgi:two-component system, NarL family, nitrate/nitrite response regulator NarL
MKKITLFILDDHKMLIDGLKALLQNETQFKIIGEATNGKKALEFISKHVPDIVMSDISMPEMDGVAFTKALHINFPDVKVLALSMYSEKSYISEMLEAGASGYILKNTGKQELITALQKIATGGMYFSDEVSATMMKAFTERDNTPQKPQVFLTERELEIVKLIAKEYSNAQIADELFISERTVETHRKNIFRKTNTKTVIGLIKYLIENKII